MRNPLVLFGYLLGCYVISFIAAEGALEGLGTWFLVIDRPAWALPMGLYVPLWTILYGLLAFAGWVAWTSERRSRAVLALFISSLLLGGLWPWLFFAKHALAASLAEGLIAWAFALATVILAFRVKAAAGLLMLPYLAWLTYAAALNTTIMRMNGSRQTVITVTSRCSPNLCLKRPAIRPFFASSPQLDFQATISRPS
jgi:benzodiazapine receptor